MLMLLCVFVYLCLFFIFFFFNDTATTEIYTLSLHDALPICEDGLIGFVMEWENVDFSASNDFSALLEFNEFGFEALESDVALVYLLWDVDESTGDEIWRQLQQTLIIPEGILQYNYDFTRFDTSVFMDADFDLGVLGALDTDDWVVRVVVVPGEFVGGRKAASEISYQELEEQLGLPQLKRRSSNGLSRRD